METYIISTVPPSVNSMYRGGRRYLTQRGRDLKNEIEWEIASQRKNGPMSGPVKKIVHFHFPDKRKRDIDNCAKAVLDCCTGVLYHDDSQVSELHLYKSVDAANPRTVVQVYE